MEHKDDTERFGVEQLFGSRTRSRLMQLFLKKAEERFFVRELTRKVDAQLNSVRRELQNLVELGLVVELDEKSEKKTERKKYYQVNTNFILFEELRALFGKAGQMIQQDLLRTLLEDAAIQVLIVTGVFVGKVDAETDLLVVGSPQMDALAGRVTQCEALLGREINYTVMPTDEYLYRRDVTDRFLHSILDAEHVVIHQTL